MFAQLSKLLKLCITQPALKVFLLQMLVLSIAMQTKLKNIEKCIITDAARQHRFAEFSLSAYIPAVGLAHGRTSQYGHQRAVCLFRISFETICLAGGLDACVAHMMRHFVVPLAGVARTFV